MLQVEGGSVIVRGCEFQANRPQIALGAAVRRRDHGQLDHRFAADHQCQSAHFVISNNHGRGQTNHPLSASNSDLDHTRSSATPPGMNRLKHPGLARREFLSSLGVWASATAFTPSLLGALNRTPARMPPGCPAHLGSHRGEGPDPRPRLGAGRPEQTGTAAGVAVYRAALEAGINYVDTAHIYDDAETYLGELVPEVARPDFPRHQGTAGKRRRWGSLPAMQQQFEESLRRLKPTTWTCCTSQRSRQRPGHDPRTGRPVGLCEETGRRKASRASSASPHTTVTRASPNYSRPARWMC